MISVELLHKLVSSEGPGMESHSSVERPDRQLEVEDCSAIWKRNRIPRLMAR